MSEKLFAFDVFTKAGKRLLRYTTRATSEGEARSKAERFAAKMKDATLIQPRGGGDSGGPGMFLFR